MKRMAFISRHAPTAAQIERAAEAGWELVAVGDRDAFDQAAIQNTIRDFDGVAVVHPLAALYAKVEGYPVGVFENVQRPGPDGKPVFECGRFVVV